MKICPRCGAKMAANVNFCTQCGYDLRKVEVAKSSKTQKKTTVAEAQSKQQKQATGEKAAEAGQHLKAAASDFSQAVKSVDYQNMWQWFVNSWRHPFRRQKAPSWYGWLTLLIENILLLFSLLIGIRDTVVNGTNAFDNATNGNVGSQIGDRVASGGLSYILELLIFVLLLQAAFILAAYGAHHFLYVHTDPILFFTNRVVQASNLNAILTVAAFIFFLMGTAMLTFAILLTTIGVVFFDVALFVIALGDDGAVRDKFYGGLIMVGIQFLSSLILSGIFGAAVINQIETQFSNLF